MAKVQLDCRTFKERMENITLALPDDVDGLMITFGERDSTFSYGINSAMFFYLLGYEFPATSLIIRKTEVIAVSSAKKCLILDQLKETVSIRTFSRMKDLSNQQAILSSIREICGDKPLGVLKEERGESVRAWEGALSVKDITPCIESVLLKKDRKQQDLMRLASVSAMQISMLLESKIKQIIKTDDRVIHEELSDQIEAALEVEMKRLPDELDQSYIELCFTPVIQSGGRYLKEKTERGEFVNPYKEQLLYFDIISYYLWVAYKGHCSHVGRTLLVSPNKKSKVVLGYVLRLMKYLLRNISIERTPEQIKSETMKRFNDVVDPMYQEELGRKIKMELGPSIGIRPEEGGAGGMEAQKIQSNSLFVVSVGFYDLVHMIEEDDRIGTVHMENVVMMEGGAPKLLTPFSPEVSDYVYEKAEEQTKRTLMGRRLRNRDRELERANEINEHQKQLMDELIEEQLQFYKTHEVQEEEEAVEAAEKFVSYEKEALIPRGSPVIKIDKKASSVVIPVFGAAVPFHIDTIKTATKTIEDQIGYLKISFYQPSGETTSSANFLLSLLIKDTQENVMTAWKEINNMKKEEEEDSGDFVEEGEQEDLQVVQDRVETLQNVFMRCDHRMGTKKNVASTVELHKNGLRYHSKTAGDIDILFSKIKHMFLQPGAAESPTILHFRLSAPIMVADKRTADIQFFRDCTANAVHDTRKTRNRAGGEDAEMYEEEEEERMREEINDAFYEFAQHVTRKSRVTLEEPISKGFYGVPHRQSVLIQPTAECLVNLTEFPFFILPLKEIEILNFERRVSGVTTSDLVFVLKDKSKAPMHVYGISASSVPWMMDFFDSKNICFTETKVNIQWNNVIRSILNDPVAFYEGGAWAILQPSREVGDGEEEAADDDDAVDLDTSEESEDEEEDFLTDEDLAESEEEEESEEQDSYVGADDSDENSFVVSDEPEESEDEAPQKKKHKR
ncbi:uncharacterized protein NEMAJ01_0965 [Nematocida major]|uniref:uncharacterized protein n=1 Tax=Nematocida major TaxID=1912982 RepID=UPI0020086F5A|nr:uncharacterized protein NEMAJ01_0965 [Nematocida major]KAH9386069.1 hypothetical protein NEMAJ01_0965 [Nematocida major]